MITAKVQKDLDNLIERCNSGGNSNIDSLRRDLGTLAGIFKIVIKKSGVEREIVADDK